MTETFHEWAYRTSNELEAAYVEHIRQGNKKEAYNVARRARDIAKRIAEDSEEAGYMREIYAKKMSLWDERIKQSDTPQSISTTPREDTAPSFSPSPRSEVRLDDIAGLAEVKQLIKNKVILPFKYPEEEKLYKKKPKRTHGILLYGPPGTGKTMTCAAISGELDMIEYRIKASEIISPELGVSLANLQAFLDTVRKDDSPRKLVLFDEIDALAGQRTSGSQGADAEMGRLLTVLLQGIDDIKKANRDKCILFIGTTNCPSSIDPALLRGERIDEQIYVGLPDYEARRFLVEQALGGSVPPKEDGLDLDRLARDLKGYSAGDVTTICDKISDVPYLRHCETNCPTVLTRADIDTVLKNHPTSVPFEVMKPYYDYNRKRGYKTPEID